MKVEQVDKDCWIIRNDKNKYVGLILLHADGEYVSVREGKIIGREFDLNKAMSHYEE